MSEPFDEAAQHIWFKPHFLKHECCRKCGVVRRADDKNGPCKKGVRVALRDYYTEGTPTHD